MQNNGGEIQDRQMFFLLLRSSPEVIIGTKVDCTIRLNFVNNIYASLYFQARRSVSIETARTDFFKGSYNCARWSLYKLDPVSATDRIEASGFSLNSRRFYNS